MAALDAGSIVVAAGAFRAPPLSHEQLPLLGVCESATAGPPPTAVVIAWGNGTRISYANPSDLAASTLYQVLTPTHPSLVGSIVGPTAASAIPNPGSRVRGPVAMHANIADPSGNLIGEFVVVETPIGFVVMAYSNVAVVPSA